MCSLQFLDCVCANCTRCSRLFNGPEFTSTTHHPQPQTTCDMPPMEQLDEHVGHHSIPPALIAALILLVVLIVLPNVFLAPTNPKDKAD